MRDVGPFMVQVQINRYT